MTLVYVLQGFELQDPLGNLQDSVTVEIYANSEETAIEKAKKLVNKPHWRVSRVVEYKNGNSK